MFDDRYVYGDVSVEDLIARYRKLYTGAVYDVMDRLGYPNQALANEIKPVRDDMVVAGPAFTLKGITDHTGDPDLRGRRITMFNDMKATGVPLVDVRESGGDRLAAHYGEMNATVGKACGVVGAITDGGTRDTGFILKQDFPVFSAYRNPVEAFGRWSYYKWQVPVALRGALTAIVMIEPGDFILGDLDGVVAIPRSIVVETLEQTEKLVAEENIARAEFSTGADPVEVYRRHGRL